MPKCEEQHSAPLPGLDRSSALFPARVLPHERKKLTKGQTMKDTQKKKALPGFFLCIARAPKPYLFIEIPVTRILKSRTSCKKGILREVMESFRGLGIW
jgi:hypothetical protein